MISYDGWVNKRKTKHLHLLKNYQRGGGFYFKLFTEKAKVLELETKMTDVIFHKFPGTTYYFYYDDNDDLVGHVAIQQPNEDIHPTLGENMNGRFYIWAVEILEKHRGKGLGTQMMSRVLDNDKEYILQVEKDNIAAVKLYKRLGFEIYKQVIKKDSKGNNVDKYFMTRKKL